jgi:deoxyribose-phosphate aldolase
MNKETLLQLITFIDLTSLGNLDNESAITELVEQANEGQDHHYPAAVCVYSNFGDMVRSNLNSKIKTAVVGGNFPTGQGLSTAKDNELSAINQTSIDEVDIVINRGELAAGNDQYVLNEIKNAKEILGSKCLKVIIESGELNPEQIKKAAEISIQGGADFVKTSTGKIDVGATEEAARIICQAIATEYENTGNKIGLKVSGGVRTVEDAMKYYAIVKETLGANWINPELFRIGASSLYKNIKNQITQID